VPSVLLLHGVSCSSVSICVLGLLLRAMSWWNRGTHLMLFWSQDVRVCLAPTERLEALYCWFYKRTNSPANYRAALDWGNILLCSPCSHRARDRIRSLSRSRRNPLSCVSLMVHRRIDPDNHAARRTSSPLRFHLPTQLANARILHSYLGFAIQDDVT